MKLSTISSAEMSISTPRAPVATILRGQVFLQRHGQAIVHVDLDGDEQGLAELEDRYAVHRSAASWRGAAGTTTLAQSAQRQREGVRQRRLGARR